MESVMAHFEGLKDLEQNSEKKYDKDLLLF